MPQGRVGGGPGPWSSSETNSSTAPQRPLERYLADVRGREAGIALAYLEGGYTQTAIAAAAQLSVSRVNRLVKSCEAKGKT